MYEIFISNMLTIRVKTNISYSEYFARLIDIQDLFSEKFVYLKEAVVSRRFVFLLVDVFYG